SNGNYKLDSGEPGMVGLTVRLLNFYTNQVLQASTSDASGNYTFRNVVPGLFTLTDLPPGATLVNSPRASSRRRGQDIARLYVGSFTLVTLRGTVFDDLNGNRKLDSGEPGVGGLMVQLQYGANNVIQSTTCDANGNYSFSNVGPGRFIITDVPPGDTIVDVK